MFCHLRVIKEIRRGKHRKANFLEASLLPFPFSTAVRSGNTEALADSMIPVSFRLLPSLSKTTVYFPEQSCTMSRTIVLTDGTTVWDNKKFRLEKETMAFLKEFSSMNRSGSFPPS